MIAEFLTAAAVVGAGGAGSALGIHLGETHGRRRRVAAVRHRIGSDRFWSGGTILHRRGIDSHVIVLVMRASAEQHTSEAVDLVSRWGVSEIERLIARSGLSGMANAKGVAAIRIRLVALGVVSGACAGAFFSVELSLVLSCCGAYAGFTAPLRAMRHEMEERAHDVERQVSQMAEAIGLGLESGLSFDRSLEFYCRRFAGGLPDALSLARTKWMYGLESRSDALQELSDSYDSALLGRVLDATVRSLRYGTSLAQSLSSAAREARAVRKSDLEERIAKAPVKMLLPVGTLILPAMLMLILGPIALELMNGF